ncbi:MAG: CheR family methyltransferase [Desulfobacterales bacterium]|jgi:chemotaxis methyl-accepting protein methylase
MDDASFHQILDHFNLSRKGYRKVRKGVKKRLSHHMQKLGCVSVREYIAAVSRAPEIEQECRMHLTVPISRFFRDRRLWDSLEITELPYLISACGSVFRVWSCGCARGEEAYSFKILWDRLRCAVPNLPLLALWATDINPAYIEMAKQGVYGISSLKELPRGDIDRYFDQVTGKKRYVVKPFLKEGIRFDHHDITKHPPPSTQFEVVFLRNNLLTYYRAPEKEKALETILRALAPGGMLITGSHEKLPEGFGLMKASAEHPWIFFKPQIAQGVM